MKLRNNFKNLFYLAMILIAGSLVSCVKNRNQPTDLYGTSTQPMVEIPEGGFSNFAPSALNVSGTSDTISFHINLASINTLSSDLTVSLDYDGTALSTYNGTSVVQYQKFPDSIYSFKQKSVVIKAGQHVANVSMVVYPDKIDPTQNYMFPISIKDAQGKAISGNFGTIWYHLIGNPLAGSYLWDFTRWNNNTGTGTPSTLSFTGASTVLSPINPTQLEVPSGYFIQPRYEITFDNNAGVLSNFNVTLNSDDVAAMAAAGVTVLSGPNILTADPVTKTFKFQYVVTNGSAFRYIIDKYYKP